MNDYTFQAPSTCVAQVLSRQAGLFTSVTVGAFDVQPLKVRQDNVIPPSMAAQKADLKEGTSGVGYVQGNVGAHTPAPCPAGLDQR